MKANPGQAYDPSGTEHEDWYKENDLAFDTKKFDIAEARLEVRRESAKIISEREKAIQARTVQQQVRTGIASDQSEAIAALLKESVPDETFKSLDDLAEKDPIASPIVERVANELNPMLTELRILFTPELGVKADENNPIHVKLLEKVYEIENALMAGPKSDQIRNRKQLVTLEDFHRLSPQQRERVWTIWTDPDTIRASMVAEAQQKAKTGVEKMRDMALKYAEKKLGKKSDATSKTPDEKSKADDVPVKPASTPPPNTSGGEDQVTGGSDRRAGPSQLADSMDKVLFG